MPPDCVGSQNQCSGGNGGGGNYAPQRSEEARLTPALHQGNQRRIAQHEVHQGDASGAGLGFPETLRFDGCKRRRLFNQHMFAGLHGRAGNGSMRVGWCGNRYAVDFGIGQQRFPATHAAHTGWGRVQCGIGHGHYVNIRERLPGVMQKAAKAAISDKSQPKHQHA